jgi:hypothetical protein
MNWIEGQDVHGFTVEKHELPRSGGRPFRSMPTDTGILVVHTTEGSSVAGAIATLAANFDGPHFVVGEDRIIQGRPIGVQGASVHMPENQFPVIQVECVGFSQRNLWLFDDWANHTFINNAHKRVPIPIPRGSTLKPLAALIAWAVKNLGVPLQRPSANWRDDLSDIHGDPATNNNRRTSGVWPKVKGIYGHVEVANQQPSNHWDPGALNYTVLFQQVQALIDG